MTDAPAPPASPPQPLLAWVRAHLVERTLRRLPRTEEVLDLCCGYGFYFTINPHAEGIDGDPVSVAKLRSEGRSVVQRDVLAGLPYPDGRFRHVIAHDVFEHFTPEELRGLLPEIHRVLAPGGQLWVFVPNRRGYDDGVRRDVGHKHFVTAADIDAQRLPWFDLVRAYPEPLPRAIGEYFVHNKEVFQLRRREVPAGDS